MIFQNVYVNEHFFPQEREERSVALHSDIILVRKSQDGDLNAFNKLVEQYKSRLFSIVYNLTSNREDTMDLLQEIFLKAFNSIKKFREKSAFYTWLYQITLNTTYSFLRTRRNKNFFNLETLSESEMQEYFTSKISCEKSLFLKELQVKLNEGFQLLSVKHRTVLVLHEIDGLDHSEIAKVLKTSEGTVRSRLFYAKNQLQNYLKEFISKH